jgi:hypothetical protein
MNDIEQHGMVIFVNNNILDNGTGITIHYIKLFKSTSRLRAQRKIGHYSMSALNQAKNQSSSHDPMFQMKLKFNQLKLSLKLRMLI